MISVSGALIVTRASSEAKLGADFQKQIFSNSQPLLLASGVLIAMAAFPGLPKIPFLLLGGGLGSMAWRMRQKSEVSEKASAPAQKAPAKENVESLLRVEPLAVEVGLGLLKMVEGGPNSALLRRIASIRRQLASDLGYVLPPVRVTDNLALKAREYLILLKGVEIARYELAAGMELAIHPGQKPPPLDGIQTKEPAFGIAAVWVAPQAAERARSAGYAIVDPISVMGTHLGELVRRHAYELFSRQDTKKLMDRVMEDNAKAVEDLVPKLLSLAAVQKVLQNLLRERVSIRDAVTILEALGEAASITKNTVLLTEYVRQAIRRQVVKPFLNAAGELPAYFLDQSTEQAIEGAVEHSESASHLNLAPQRVREILDRVTRFCGSSDTPLVVLASSGSRFFLRQITESAAPNLTAISHNEVPAGVKILSLGILQ